MNFFKKILDPKFDYKKQALYFLPNSKFNPPAGGPTSTTGQSLIEVLLIVVLITAVISGSVGFLIQGYSITQLVSDQTTATYLAMEGIEVTKNLLDANYLQDRNLAWNRNGFDRPGIYEVDYQSTWDQFESTANLLSRSSFVSINDNPYGYENKLKFDSQNNNYGYFGNTSVMADFTPQQFIRRIEITPVDINEVKVVSVVNWKGRRCSSALTGCEIRLEDHFYNWR